MPTTVYHERLDLSAYDDAFAAIPEGEYNHHDVTSPFDAWSTNKLRLKCNLQGVRTVPTDIFVWDRGLGAHDCTTRIGGPPAWQPGRDLPSESKRFGFLRSGLKFFGQFNLADSKDLLPPLPGYLLSVWGTDKFPWEPKSVKTFWLDPATARIVPGLSDDIRMPLLPPDPFVGSLYRTWDPEPDQDLPTAQVDHQFESYREYSPRRWNATKVGGCESMPQWGSDPKTGQFLFQFSSIQPADEVPFPWVNQEKPLTLEFDEGGIYHDSNCLVLGDMGAIAFSLKPNGEITTLFECG